jgi:putative flippase GtrA
MRNDYRIAAFAGFFTAVFLLPVFYNLEITFPFGLSRFVVLIVIPVLWMLGIGFGKFASHWVPIMSQISRYVAAGFLSFAIDFGILNTLIFFTGITAGGGFALIKGGGYLIANINAYLWNKYWVFKKYNPNKPITVNSIVGEYATFLSVSVVGFIINVSIATFLVGDVFLFGIFFIHGVGPQFGLSPKVWANVAAIVATAVAIIWNFTGYKFIVFNTKPN